MLRLLANENIPRLLIEQLRKNGHDIKWVNEGNRGISDPAVLAEAIAESRILLTMDKDFGEFVFRHGLRATCGIILLRVISTSQKEFTELVLPILEMNQPKWDRHFSVISNRRIRVIDLPDR